MGKLNQMPVVKKSILKKIINYTLKIQNINH